MLPEILQKYKIMYPNITFDINTTLSPNVIKLVQTEKADLGIVRGDFSFCGEKKLISVDECYLFSGVPFEIEDLPNMTRISYPISPSSQVLFDDWWYENFSHPSEIGFHVSSLTLSYEMVKKGLRYSFALTQGWDFSNDVLVKRAMIRKDGTPVTRNTWLIYNHKDILSSAAKRFIQLL